MNHRPRGRWHVLLLGAILLGFLLRVADLGAQSLWYDEGVTAAVSQQGVAQLTRWTANDIQPPLYYLILSPWTRLMGTSEWSLRFPSVLAGVVGLALLYALGRRIWQRRPLIARPSSASGKHDDGGLVVAPGTLPSDPDHGSSAWTRLAVPWLAVFLAALAPQWVYYAQEARNYTLLTSLGMLAAYLLLRIAATPDSRQRLYLWVAFVVAALAALYTHYFALFLLAALALFYAIIWLRDRTQRRRRAVEGLLAAAAVLAGYAPWLPFLLNRYRIDTSYWPGALKLDEALRHLAINSTLGAPEMMLEAAAVGLLWVWAGVLLAAVVGVWTALKRPEAPRDARRRLLFVLLYLSVPVACVLLLAVSTPKFNPRYTLLATPALYLLLGLGLGQPPPPSLRRIPYPQLAVLAIVVTSAMALYNWYQVPAFAKADWRGAAQYVREHAGTTDGVVLVSGHAAPVWDYYAPDLPPLRLPPIDVLDVNQVLGYDAAPALQAGLAGKTGAWLVTWQDEVVDPVGFAADFLGRAGREVAQPRFQQVGLRYFELPAGASFSSEPPVTFPVHANFDGLVELIGWRVEPCATPPCPLRLEWRALQSALPDLKLAGEVVDAEGHVWARVPDQRLAGYQYPTTRWTAGQPLFGRIDLPWWQGTPPGTYDLILRVYAEGETAARSVLDAAGSPQGPSVRLTGIELAGGVTSGAAGPPAPDGAATGPTDSPLDLAPGVSLLDYWLAPTTAGAGQPLDLAVRYLVQPPATEGAWQAEWLAPDGQTTVPNATAVLAVDEPSQPTVGLAQLTPRVPLTATAGIWHVVLAWLDASGTPTGDPIRIPVQVSATQRSFTLPALERPLHANFGDELSLAGAVLPVQRALPGTEFPVTLVWQTLATPARDLTGFVQLLDGEGRLVTQAPDRPPGERPTSAWLPGEVVSSTQSLSLPPDLTPGTYRLIAGVYDAQAIGSPRVRLVPDGTDHVALGEVVVETP